MGLVQTAKPQNLAVDLIQAKDHCELSPSDTSHDAKMTRLVQAATADVERFTRRALITQSWRFTLREFRQRIYLPRPNLQSVTSVVYIDDDGDEITLSPSLYQVSTDAKPGYIEPAYNEEWPSVRPETIDAVQITYVAGFGNTYGDVPAEFQNAIYELTAFRFMNRGDVQTDIPKHIKWLLSDLRCGAVLDYYEIKD